MGEPGGVTGIDVKMMKNNPPQSPLVRGEDTPSSQSLLEEKAGASSPHPLDNPPDKGGRGVGGRRVQRAIYLPYDKNLTALARENRRNPTPAESLLWNKVLRCRQFARYKFLRQKPIGSYIVDFYCSELQLVIEIDGDSHARQIEYDGERTRFLNSLGLEVVRYANQEVLHDLAGVFADLSRRVETRT
ncbi:endonuclease domain-containing protein [Methylococcus geothermalis]